MPNGVRDVADKTLRVTNLVKREKRQSSKASEGVKISKYFTPKNGKNSPVAPSQKTVSSDMKASCMSASSLKGARLNSKMPHELKDRDQ